MSSGVNEWSLASVKHKHQPLCAPCRGGRGYLVRFCTCAGAPPIAPVAGSIHIPFGNCGCVRNDVSVLPTYDGLLGCPIFSATTATT